MTQEEIRRYYKKLKPYSHQDYTRDAKSIIVTRIIAGRFDHSALFNKQVADPSHAAQWSVLSRKRKSGLMLLTLYVIAIRYKLDMTATLGQRILQGIYGTGMSNTILLQAFAKSGRTAADKSEDWVNLDKIIDENKEYFIEKMARSKAIVLTNKELAWELAAVQLSGN